MFLFSEELLALPQCPANISFTYHTQGGLCGPATHSGSGGWWLCLRCGGGGPEASLLLLVGPVQAQDPESAWDRSAGSTLPPKASCICLKTSPRGCGEGGWVWTVPFQTDSQVTVLVRLCFEAGNDTSRGRCGVFADGHILQREGVFLLFLPLPQAL